MKKLKADELTHQMLPISGMSRWNQIAPFSPFSKEKFRQLVRAGKAPQPIKFSERCTAYSNVELHKFFKDPLNYCSNVEVISDKISNSKLKNLD
jgi:hypothetical protein